MTFLFLKRKTQALLEMLNRYFFNCRSNSTASPRQPQGPKPAPTFTPISIKKFFMESQQTTVA